MAYQFCDTFDHYNTAQLQALNMWETVVGSPVISSAYARFASTGSYPNQGVQIPSYGYIRKNLKSNQQTLITFQSYGGPLPTGNYYPIFAWWDTGSSQCWLVVTTTGALALYRAAGPTVIAQTSNNLISSTSTTSYGIESQLTIGSGTSGSFQMWVNGVQRLNATGINTQSTGNAWANQVSLGYGYATGTVTYSDYVRVWDTTGSYQNAPLGVDCRKLTKLPQATGDLTQWTPNGAANNWQCVKDNPSDGDATYVSSNGNLYDSYGMGLAALAAAPSMVVAKSYVRKDDTQTRAIEIGIRSSGSNSLGSPSTLASSYTFVDTCISVDPVTGLPPTAAAADNFQHVKFEST